MRCICVFMLMALPAAARTPDGLLDVVITPNNGIPALVQPGGAFEVTATAAGEAAREAFPPIESGVWYWTQRRHWRPIADAVF